MVTGKHDRRDRETHTDPVVGAHPERSAGDEDVFASGSSVNPQIVQGSQFGPINFTIVEDERSGERIVDGKSVADKSVEDKSVDESGREHLNQMLGSPNREERADGARAQCDHPAHPTQAIRSGRTIAFVVAGAALLAGLGYLALF